MKNYLILILFLFVALASCDRDNDSISEEEAADLIGATLSSDDSGLGADLIYMAAKAIEEETNYSSDCNYTGDSAFSSSFSGPERSYSFNYTYDWTVTCENFIPVALNFNTTRSGDYDGRFVDHTGNGLGNFVLTDLFSGSELTLNGTYSNTGSSTLTRRGTARTIDSEVEVTLTNVKIEKTSLEINSGAAVVTVLATGEDNSVSYNGSITFLGNGALEVVVNGNVYTFSV